MDDNWDIDEEYTIEITTYPVDTFDTLPKTHTICGKCGRHITPLRCELHPEAHGCTYCHYQEKHR